MSKPLNRKTLSIKAKKRLRRKMRRQARKMYHIDKHHRQPRSLGGGNEDSNISYVNKTQHLAWHVLFSNHTPSTICQIISEKWIDSRYEVICRLKANETPTFYRAEQ